jgi:hypothetical protein
MFDRSYKNVGVFLFRDLGYDDFKVASPGSRGKSRMHKSSAFQKCVPLIGGFSDRSEKFIAQYTKALEEATTATQRSYAKQKIEMWKKKGPQIAISLESIDDIRK